MGLNRPKPAPVFLASTKKGNGDDAGVQLANAAAALTFIEPVKEKTDGEIATEIQQTQASETTKFKLTAGDFTVLKSLGSGSSGIVEKVLHKPTNVLMARKIIKLFVADEALRERTKKQILRELKILRMCMSPFVVEFYGAYAHEGDISICMELMDIGSLEGISNALGAIAEPVVCKLSVHVLQGIAYLYDTHKIVHRDIKPSNILINSRGGVKIADFGVSKDVKKSMAKTFTGTGAYLAPERLREGTAHSVESDIWSLGLTLMEIAIARFPFPPEGYSPFLSPMDLLTYIEEEPAPSLPPGQFSQEFEQFLALCLEKEVEKRPLPAALLTTPFCKRAIDGGIDLNSWALEVHQKLGIKN